MDMKTLEQINNFSEKKFQKTFGVNRKTFDYMLEILEEQYKNAHRKGGRKPKVSIFDRLCIFFAYYRDYRTIADIANEYNLAESTTFDIIHLVEKSLMESGKFNLPSKRELLCNSSDTIIIDATECEIERPKKSKENITVGKRKSIQ